MREYYRNMSKRFSSDKFDIVIALLICSFIAFFYWLSSRQFSQLLCDGYDQGTYRQILWTTLHGKLFWCSFTASHGLCDLGVHMDLILGLLLPFYWLFPFPLTLLTIQIVFLALGAIPLYLLAKEKINARAGLLFAVFYLTNNFVVQSIIEGFQARTFSMPLYLFAFYSLYKKRYLLLKLFLLLLCISHEVNSLLVFMLGVYMALFREEKKMGALTAAAGLAWFILCIKVFQPYFGVHEPLGALYFMVEGKAVGDPLKIILYCFSHPLEIMQRAFSYPKLNYFIRLFAPLGFLSLFGPKELLIALPVFLQNFILSEHLIKIEIPRYTMALIPFIFISAIYSAVYFFKKLKSRWEALEAILIASWVISTYAFVWNPNYNPRFLRMLSPAPAGVKNHAEAMKRIAGLIPPDASVCADIKAFPFLANRFMLYDMPLHISESDYALVDVKDPVLSPKPTMPREKYLEIMNGALVSPEFETVAGEDGIILLKRRNIQK